MKSLSTLALLFVTTLGFSQITLTKNDFPVKGDTVPTKSAVVKPNKLPLAVFNTSSATFNLDLSGMKIVENGQEIFDDPSNLTGGADVKSAEFGYATTEGTLFFKQSSSSLEIVGIGQEIQTAGFGFELDSSIEFLNAPLTYPYSQTDSAFTTRNILGIAQADVSVKSEYEVNGYGSLKVPGDSSFDVIRIKRKMYFHTVTKISFPIPSTDVRDDSLVTWEFYANDVKSTVLRVLGQYVTDAGQNIIDTNIIFTFYDNSPVITNIAQPVIDQDLSITVQGRTATVMSAEELSGLEIIGMDGKRVFVSTTVKSGLPVHLPQFQNGVYLIKATTVSGRSEVKKFLF